MCYYIINLFKCKVEAVYDFLVFNTKFEQSLYSNSIVP